MALKEKNRTAQGQPWAPSLSKDLSKSMAVLTKEYLNRFLVYFLKVYIQKLIAPFSHKVGETWPLNLISNSHFAVWQNPLRSFGVGNYAPSHCLIGSDPGRKQQSIEPSCIPLSTLCTRRWTTSDNLINSTALKPFCPKRQATIPTGTNLAAEGKRFSELRETLEGKILQGDLLKCFHFTYQFTFCGIFHISPSWPTAGLQSLAEGLIAPVSCSNWTSMLMVVPSGSSPVWNLGPDLGADKKSTKPERNWKECLWGHVTAENEHGSHWQVGFWRCWSRHRSLEYSWKRAREGQYNFISLHAAGVEVLKLCMAEAVWGAEKPGNGDGSSHHLHFGDFQNLARPSTIWSNFTVGSALCRRLDLVVCSGSLQPEWLTPLQALQP